MLKNHLKIAFRQLARNKVFSGINILGLSLGMALAILIAVFIKGEFSYDKWMANSENTYRVYRDWGEDHTAFTPSRLAKKLTEEYPEVAVAAAFSPWGEQLVTYNNNSFYVEETARVDSAFFKVLGMSFLHGDQQTALNQLNDMVLTDRMAKKIFGDVNPVGEILTYNAVDEFIIAGVIDTKGKNSHLQTDIYTRFDPNSQTYWAGNDRFTYARLNPNTNLPALEEKLTADVSSLIKAEFESFSYAYTAEDIANWAFQPLTEVYLQSFNNYTIGVKEGSIKNIYIYLLIGFLVLSVAIINYINLTTARASQRSKEVGVKKVAGAGRGLLAGQFITESVLQAFVAGTCALIIAELSLPFFNTITDRTLQVLAGAPFWIVAGTFGLALLTGLLAGIYPAFVMSAYRPVVALKSNFLKAGEKGLFRKVLVTGQFAVTITLLIVMAFIYRQVNFMMEQDLGFKPDQVLKIPLNSSQTHRKIANLKPRIKNIEGVKDVTTASEFPGDFFSDWAMSIEGRTERIDPNVLFADADLANTLDLELLEGRFLDDNNPADSISNFVVNQTFIKRTNIKAPIGARVKFTADSTYGRIVGVIKDFHFQGLNHKIKPLVMTTRHQRWHAGIKLSTQNLSKTIENIKQVWAEIEPNHPMRYTFLDEDFANQYEEQQRFGSTILYATLLTLFIALLGLFGLTAFTVERRTREIGIRKVLGASVTGIIGLLAQDFMKLVLLASLIAIPLGYLLTNQWLADFPHRTTMVWWVFAGAGLSILVVGFLTVCLQSVKAAMANPVKAIKTE